MFNTSWATFKLAFTGTVTRVVIDTRLFAGNAPYMVRVQGALLEKNTSSLIVNWQNIIPQACVSLIKIFTFQRFG